MCDADKRTLCTRCYRDYVSAGYAIRRDYDVTVKDSCDFCGYTSGWTYYIIEDKALIR